MSARSSVTATGMYLKLGRLMVTMETNCAPLQFVPEPHRVLTVWCRRHAAGSIHVRGFRFLIDWTGSKDSASPTPTKMEDTVWTSSDVMEPNKAWLVDERPMTWENVEKSFPQSLLYSPSTTDSASSPE